MEPKEIVKIQDFQVQILLFGLHLELNLEFLAQDDHKWVATINNLYIISFLQCDDTSYFKPSHISIGIGTALVAGG